MKGYYEALLIHTLLYLPSDFRVAYAANISEHFFQMRDRPQRPGTEPLLFSRPLQLLEQCVASFTSHRINYEELSDGAYG